MKRENLFCMLAFIIIHTTLSANLFNAIAFKWLQAETHHILWNYVPEFLSGAQIQGFGNVLISVRKFTGIIFTVYTFFIAYIIFLENKNPSKTIAWLLVLFLLPVVGFVLYLILGLNIRKKTMFKKKKYRDFEYFTQLAALQKNGIDECQLFSTEESAQKRKFIKLILSNSRAPFTTNNASRILNNGEETFEAIFSAIEGAKDHIHLEYYIVKDDQVGEQFRELLCKKAREGVKVRLLYDCVGSTGLKKRYIERLEACGVETRGFLPVSFPFVRRELNYRNHRKIVVVDGGVGFIGGINIGDEYLGKDPKLGFWRDTQMEICGEAVYGLQNIFIMDWYFVTKELLPMNQAYFPKVGHCGEQIVQIASSGPDSDWESILQAYFSIISSAQKRIWLSTPYLVPDESVMMALKVAALSGTDVRIILPSKADHHTVFWASMANLEELLEAGVKVYKYEKGFIHSKIVIIDDELVSIGTANMDIRSFQINFEVNAFVYDEALVEKAEKDFLEDIGDSMELTLEAHKRRPFANRLKEAAGRLFSPLL